MRVYTVLLCLLFAVLSFAAPLKPGYNHEYEVFEEFRKAFAEMAGEPGSFEEKTIKAHAIAEERVAKAG